MINCLLVKQCTSTKTNQRWIVKFYIFRICNAAQIKNEKGENWESWEIWESCHRHKTCGRETNPVLFTGLSGGYNNTKHFLLCQPFPDSNYIVSFNTLRTAIRHSHIVTRRKTPYEICNWVKRVMYFDNTHCWRTLLSSRCYCSDEIDEMVDSPTLTPTHSHSL